MTKNLHLLFVNSMIVYPSVSEDNWQY